MIVKSILPVFCHFGERLHPSPTLPRPSRRGNPATMKKHYVCKPQVWHESPLVFDWDIETGEISGPSAERILEFAACRAVPIYPPPQDWDLSSEPLKSKADMAAIIGYRHELPEDLREHYPRPWNPETDFDPDVIY